MIEPNYLLIESGDFMDPGEICIVWYARSQIRERVLSGNDADEFMERYRAAPDEEHRGLVMAHMVENFQ
jgi:hypothetical protein